MASGISKSVLPSCINGMVAISRPTVSADIIRISVLLDHTGFYVMAGSTKGLELICAYIEQV